MLKNGSARVHYRNNTEKQKQYNLPELLGRIEDGIVFIDTEYAIRPENSDKFPDCPHIVFSADETNNFFMYKGYEEDDHKTKYFYRFAHVYDDKMFIIVDEDSNSYQMWPLIYHAKWEGTCLALDKQPPAVSDQIEENETLIENEIVFPIHPYERYSKKLYDRYSSQGGVYILLYKEEIVYVGMSESNMSKRIKCHRSNKTFDKVMCLSVENNYCHTGIENVLIKFFKPKYNKAVGGTEWSQKSKAFCKALSKKIDVRTLCEKLEIQRGFRVEDYPISLDILPSLKDVTHEFGWLSKNVEVKQFVLEHSEYRSQATIEGLNRAKQEGKKLGRKPTINDETKSNIIKEKLDGSSLSQIAKKYSISRAGVQHVMRGYKSAL
jgi:hypothetical protein